MTERHTDLKTNDAFDALTNKSLEAELKEKVHIEAWTWKDLRDIRNGIFASIFAALIIALAALAVVLTQAFLDRSKSTQTPHKAPAENPIQEAPVPSVRIKEREGWHVTDI
ncbi:hypothetical protein [Algirhabdus cladophorae]|uniref:hypothetical protein n=1 Tax=Algirhabdus cladophorae TaxID=3377108 RepID=UPI003B84979E